MAQLPIESEGVPEEEQKFRIDDRLQHDGDSEPSSSFKRRIEMGNSTQRSPLPVPPPISNPLNDIQAEQPSYNHVASFSNNMNNRLATMTQVHDKSGDSNSTKISRVICIILLLYSVAGVTYLLWKIHFTNSTNCECMSFDSQQIARNGNNATWSPTHFPSASPLVSPTMDIITTSNTHTPSVCLFCASISCVFQIYANNTAYP